MTTIFDRRVDQYGFPVGCLVVNRLIAENIEHEGEESRTRGKKCIMFVPTDVTPRKREKNEEKKHWQFFLVVLHFSRGRHHLN